MTPDDIVSCRRATFTCKLPYRVVRHRATKKLNQVQFLRQCRCGNVYNIVRYVNRAVKSMRSITATPDDIVRHRTMSYDVVRCRAQCEHRLKQVGARPDSRCNMRPSRVITDYILTQFHICVYSYFVTCSRFFSNLHLIVIQSLNLWESQLLVSCIYVSSKFEVSTKFRFPTKVVGMGQTDGQTDRQTDRQTDGMQRYRRRNENTRSLLVLRAVWRQRRTVYVIFAIFER